MILMNVKRVLRNSKLTIGGYVMNTVRELLQDKIHEVASVEPDKTAHEAMQLMAEKK